MSKAIFIKYSDNRKEEFSIITKICVDEDGKKHVKKEAATAEALEHIKGIYSFYSEKEAEYKAGGLLLNRCELKDGEAVLQYLEGENLDEKIYNLCLSGDEQKAFELVKEYFEKVSMVCKTRTGVFRCENEVFGEIPGTDGLYLAAPADIDLDFDNVIINDSWNIIDYEWNFDIDIPLKYIIWRVLYNFYLHHSNLKESLRRDIYECYGISREDEIKYKAMEKTFQEYISDPDSLRNYEGSHDLSRDFAISNDFFYVNVYEGAEKDGAEIKKIHDAHVNSREIEIPEISESESGWYILEITEGPFVIAFSDRVKREYDEIKPINGMNLRDGSILFIADKAEIRLHRKTPGAGISFKIISISQDNIPAYDSLLRTIFAQQEAMDRIETSRLWRFRKKIKVLTGR